MRNYIFNLKNNTLEVSLTLPKVNKDQKFETVMTTDVIFDIAKKYKVLSILKREILRSNRLSDVTGTWAFTILVPASESVSTTSKEKSTNTSKEKSTKTEK